MTNIQGTSGIDFLNGTIDADLIFAYADNDLVRGLDGNDIIYGSQGADILYGDRGADSLYGETENDSLYGGKGMDLLMGNEGNDLLTGGAGNDIFVLSRGAGIDTITDFSQGGDRILLLGNLKYDDLDIVNNNNQTTIIDRSTGQNIAILPQNINLERGDLVSLSNNLELGQILPIGANLNISGQTIKIEVARTPQEQGTGLMYRTDLAENQGMLFIFDPPQSVGFWMKNTLINLDLIFLKNGVIQQIFADVPPCITDPCPSYQSLTEIDSVLELSGGRTNQLNLKVGDQLDINFT